MKNIIYSELVTIGIDHKLNENDLFIFIEFMELRFPDAVEPYIREWAARFAIGREHAIKCMDRQSKYIFYKIENRLRGFE